MDKQELERLLEEAEGVAAAVSEPYRAVAFEVVARHLLRQVTATAPIRKAVTDQGANGRRQDSEEIPESVNEVLALMRSRPHPDRFEAIIFHALKREGQQSISTDDILGAYSVARLSRPVNASDVLAKCFRKGHITEGPRREGQKTWRLTTSGERHAETLLRELLDGNQK